MEEFFLNSSKGIPLGLALVNKFFPGWDLNIITKQDTDSWKNSVPGYSSLSVVTRGVGVHNYIGLSTNY